MSVVMRFSDNNKLQKSQYNVHKLSWEPQDAGFFFTALILF